MGLRGARLQTLTVKPPRRVECGYVATGDHYREHADRDRLLGRRERD